MIRMAFLTLGLLLFGLAKGDSRPFATPDPSERYPTGALTVHGLARFGAPLPPFDDERAEQWLIGRSFFRDPWVAAPASTTARDGLGPVYNARSCAACHNNTEREPIRTAVVRLSGPSSSVYGAELQTLGEGALTVEYVPIRGRYDDGVPYHLRKPIYTTSDLTYGPLHPNTKLSVRVAPPLLGLGLLETIPEATLLANADPLDVDGDGISGRPNKVREARTGSTVLGRFGWKADQPSVIQQTAAAFRDDIGITSTLFPEQPCTAHQIECLAAPNGNDPATGVEIDDKFLTAVALMSATQGASERRRWRDPAVLRGKQSFRQLGCTACHTPRYVTASRPGQPELSEQTIWPFTDLLLHDMGTALDDQHPDFEATGREWRTPPLWGLSSRRPHYLHDGRARTLAEAILWHDGEAAAAQRAFKALPATERQDLINYLESL